MIIPTLRISDNKLYFDMIQNYCREGITAIRVNMDGCPMERYCNDIQYINQIAEYPFEIMADIPVPGRKYRVDLRSGQELVLRKGELVQFTAKAHGRAGAVRVLADSFSGASEGGQIIIGDGELALTVVSAGKEVLAAAADHDGSIRGQRSFLLLDSLAYEKNTEHLGMYIEAFKRIRPSKIVLSFSEEPGIIEEIRAKIQESLGNVQVIPKIETKKGVLNSKAICSAFKEVMLGRSTLAIFGDPCSFGENQAAVLEAAREAGTNVIASAGILASLDGQQIPSRSDLTDLYYLKKRAVKDVVASARISKDCGRFRLFCEYARDFR